MKLLHDKWALVTGASSGMGKDFAAVLAEKGANLFLAARRIEPMERLAEELRLKYQVDVRVESIDLSADGAAAELKERIEKQGIGIDILVNNAGYGIFGEFIEQPLEKIVEMLRLNVIGVTELTHVFANEMARRGGGDILLVASLTAYQPSPIYAAYAAGKSYVLLFGEALHAELAPRKVNVTVLSPGLMETNFLAAAGQQPNAAMRRMMMPSRSVAEAGLTALFKGKSSVVAGRMNKILAFSTRLLPRSLQSKIAYKMMQS